MSNPAFLEQVLNVIHAVDVCHLQQFTDFCSTGVFFRASILSGHIFFLHPDASILHLSGGLHNYWDGLLFFFIFWKIVQLSILRNQLDILCINELQDYIMKQRTNLESFDETLVKRWLGQITVWGDHFTVELKS